MNKKNNSTDHSTPYRTLGMEKITAPKKSAAEPKSRVISTGKDMRVRGDKA